MSKKTPTDPNCGTDAGVPANCTTQPCAPTHPPTASALQNDPTVRGAMQQAWTDSQANDPAKRHEEGGWIYMDTTTGAITTRRASSGAQSSLNIGNPPDVPGSVVVGTFHTHPNPTSEGWDPGPSDPDKAVHSRIGVPGLIQADDGVHSTGPDCRRGGLAGGGGFPP